MRVCYGQPATTFAIAGTGAAFITDSSALSNGRPAHATRVRWISGAQTTASVVVITATLAASVVAGAACLLMPNISTALPAGVKVTVAGKALGVDVVLGGNALTARVVILANGATAIHWVFPAVTIDQLVITIYNDRAGMTWATASQLFDLGEVGCFNTADFDVALDASIELDGGVLQRQSHNNQAWPFLVQPFRVATLKVVPMSAAVAIGPAGLQSDFETVINCISTSPRCAIILRYMLPGYDPVSNGLPPATITSSQIDAQQLARTFIFGVVDAPPQMTYNGDKYIVAPMKFAESPP